MTRFVDRGAIVAGWVGVGMAAVIVVSFLLVIPIEPVAWILAPFAGLIIGYYANSRADRRAGPWSRILANGAWSGLITGLSMAILIIGIKAIFFLADDGYRGDTLGGRLDCTPGPDCVYARYLAADTNGSLQANGVIDLSSFEAAYWRQALTIDGVLVGVTFAGGVVGAALYGAARPREARTGGASAG